MKVVDKEKEREEFDKTPEGKSGKMKKNAIQGVVIIVLLAIAYFCSHSPMMIGKPHPVQVGELTVTPGKTTVAEVLASGFQLAENQPNLKDMKVSYDNIISPATKAEAKTEYIAILLVRDGQSYGAVSIVNEGSAKQITECLISSISLSGAKGAAVSVDGVAWDDISPETLTEVDGKPSNTYQSAGDKQIRTVWSKGNYSLEIKTNDADGSLDMVTSKYKKKS